MMGSGNEMCIYCGNMHSIGFVCAEKRLAQSQPGDVIIINDLSQWVQKPAVAKYLIWSNEHTCWWRANSQGYSYDIKDAGRYTREEAMKICKGANYGFMQDNGKNPNEIPVLEADAIETMSAKPWVAPLKTYDCHACHDQGCDLCKTTED